jgi:uncharacterized protein (TIGR02246 family)
MDEQEICDLIKAWGVASEAGDLDTLLTLMADDVIFLTAQNRPMSRADFAAGFSNMSKSLKLKVSSDVQEVSVDGNTAVCWNRLAIEMTPVGQGKPMAYNGNVLTVLRRGDDGSWRIWRDANLLVAAK